MDVQSHPHATNKWKRWQREVVGVARAVRGRALVRLLLGPDAVRAVEPNPPPHLQGPALAKVPAMEQLLVLLFLFCSWCSFALAIGIGLLCIMVALVRSPFFSLDLILSVS